MFVRALTAAGVGGWRIMEPGNTGTFSVLSSFDELRLEKRSYHLIGQVVVPFRVFKSEFLGDLFDC